MPYTAGREESLRLILDSLDADYSQFRKDMIEGTSLSPYSWLVKSVAGQLSTDEDLVYIDGNRIILPNNANKKVLTILHISHAGVNRMYEKARSLYFWPGMLNDVKQLVES